MKLFLIAGALVLLWNASAFAGTASPMTDDQLSGVSAGTGDVKIKINNQNSQNAEGAIQPINKLEGEVENNGVNAENLSNTNVVEADNSVINDASVNTLILQNDVQQNLRAVNVVNDIRGQVANQINAVNVFEPFGSSSSGGFIPSVNQINTVVQK